MLITMGAHATTIDPEANSFDSSLSKIKSVRNKTARSMSCNLEVAYKGSVSQPVSWNGESCDKLTISFVTLSTLTDLNKMKSLSEEILSDIKALDGRRVLYIEGKFSSAIYPLNVVSRLYTVPLAD